MSLDAIAFKHGRKLFLKIFDFFQKSFDSACRHFSTQTHSHSLKLQILFHYYLLLQGPVKNAAVFKMKLRSLKSDLETKTCL